MAKVAAGLGISKSAVSMWDKVPAERLADVALLSGIPKHLLRPDVHDAPPDHDVQPQSREEPL